VKILPLLPTDGIYTAAIKMLPLLPTDGIFRDAGHPMMESILRPSKRCCLVGYLGRIKIETINLQPWMESRVEFSPDSSFVHYI
jgi:hypothetical protein